MYCIDASVMIAIFDESDVFHDVSLRMLEFVIKAKTNIIMPAFALAEIAGALTRKGYKNDDVAKYLNYLRGCRNIDFILPTNELCELAINIALQLRVKGSDSIYIAVSSFYKLTLISYDNQQRERGKSIVETAAPESIILSKE